MGMARGGSKPGERRGGRQKGTRDKKVVAEEERKIALLLSVEETFKASGYDPLQCMVDLAQKEIITVNDQARFSMHQALAKKYYSDLGALRVDATIEHKPITVVERKFKAETNGHVRSSDAV